ncbi:hypothetical protein [Endozoicomonas sp. ALD040]
MNKLYFLDGDKELVTEILVMADYEVSTWDHEGAAFCMSELDVSKELLDMIEKWERDYLLIPKYPNETNIKFDEEKFNQDGLNISIMIKDFVGDSVKVFYSDLRGNKIEIERASF